MSSRLAVAIVNPSSAGDVKAAIARRCCNAAASASATRWASAAARAAAFLCSAAVNAAWFWVPIESIIDWFEALASANVLNSLPRTSLYVAGATGCDITISSSAASSRMPPLTISSDVVSPDAKASVAALSSAIVTLPPPVVPYVVFPAPVS